MPWAKCDFKLPVLCPVSVVVYFSQLLQFSVLSLMWASCCGILAAYIASDKLQCFYDSNELTLKYLYVG